RRRTPFLQPPLTPAEREKRPRQIEAKTERLVGCRRLFHCRDCVLIPASRQPREALATRKSCEPPRVLLLAGELSQPGRDRIGLLGVRELQQRLDEISYDGKRAGIVYALVPTVTPDSLETVSCPLVIVNEQRGQAPGTERLQPVPLRSHRL